MVRLFINRSPVVTAVGECCVTSCIHPGCAAGRPFAVSVVLTDRFRKAHHRWGTSFPPPPRGPPRSCGLGRYHSRYAGVLPGAAQPIPGASVVLAVSVATAKILRSACWWADQASPRSRCGEDLCIFPHGLVGVFGVALDWWRGTAGDRVVDAQRPAAWAIPVARLGRCSRQGRGYLSR
jgi:hypothetical protein